MSKTLAERIQQRLDEYAADLTRWWEMGGCGHADTADIALLRECRKALAQVEERGREQSEDERYLRHLVHVAITKPSVLWVILEGSGEERLVRLARECRDHDPWNLAAHAEAPDAGEGVDR